MALKSTIYKAELQIANMDRHYYADHSLTIARHPSETDERMMVRVAAFALFAQERLEFCKGLSDIDEPDLWQKDLTGAIETWIEVGQPDERRIAKASGRSNEVIVIAYGGRTSEIWWQGDAQQGGPACATSQSGRSAKTSAPRLASWPNGPCACNARCRTAKPGSAAPTQIR